MLGFVLRFPRAQSFGQIIPVREQPRIVHFRDSADVARAAAVEIQSGGGRIKIFRQRRRPHVREISLPRAHEKICDAARMQLKFLADVRACESALTECGEEIESDRSQQDLGIPEAERSLQNCVRCWRNCLHRCRCSESLRSHKSRVHIERKLRACASLGAESGEGSANCRGKNVPDVRPITWLPRLIPVSWYR